MQKCSARAAVTPSGSRSDERHMHAQRDGHAFRSGQRNHFAILCLAPDFCAPRPSGVRRRISPGRAALGGASLCPHPFNSTLWFCAPYGSSHGGVNFPAASVKRKNPAEGATARRGVVSQRRKRGSASTRPTWEDAFIKGSGCRFDSRLWNPEIIDCALPAPVSHVGQPSGLH